MQNTSVQDALIKIAQLLHRDTTPTSPYIPINKTTSEGVPSLTSADITTTTSDGAKDITRFKTTINPIIPAHTTLHPSLYQQRLPTVPVQVNPVYNRSVDKPKAVRQPSNSLDFDLLLKQFANIPRSGLQ